MNVIVILNFVVSIIQFVASRTITLTLNLAGNRPVEFSIKLHTIKSGWYIVFNEGSGAIISNNIVQNLMKCHIMLHFLLAFTVRKNTHLGAQ